MKCLFLVSLLSTVISFAEESHIGSQVPENKPRVENSQPTRKLAVLKPQYIECGNESKDTTPKELPKSQFVRAMIVRELGRMWSLASEKDVQLKGAECATVLSGPNSELLGQYNLSFQDQYKCGQNRPMVPGAFVPGKGGSHNSIRYVGILPEQKINESGKIEETTASGPVQWVPTPCGTQNEDTLVSIENTEGVPMIRGFTFKENQWEPIDPIDAEASFEKMLSRITSEPGEEADKTRRCMNSLRGKIKRNMALGAEEDQIPRGTHVPERAKRDNLSLPFGSTGANSSSILRAQEGYFDD